MYYEDDPFSPCLPNDYDFESDEIPQYEDMNEDGSIASSMTSNTRRKRKLYENAKEVDKGYAKTCVFIGGKKVPIQYYHTSYNSGATIRNATTGIYETGLKVGRSNQDTLFKVVIPANKEGHQLFYDSPEQFERHFFTQLSVDIKEKWEAQAILARERHIAEEERRQTNERATIEIR